MLVVGIAASVKKAKRKAESQPEPTSKPIWEEIFEQQQKQPQPKPAAKPAPKKNIRVAAEGSIENLPHEDLSAKQTKTAASTEKSDDLKLDFDPEEMVIYSEVMKPGYEKY